MSNTFTGNYADGAALTKAMLDTAYQTLQLDIANTALTTTGSTTGQALISNGSGTAASFQTIPDPQGPFSLRNYGLKATAASGVLTVSLKSKALTDPTANDLVNFNYSTSGTTSSSYTSVNVTAATSLAINSSASLGYTSTSTSRIFVYGYYNTATANVKLAVSARGDLDVGSAVTTTAISSSADSPGVLYASASLSITPRLLGFVEAAHNSAGAWQTPTKVNVTNNKQQGLAISSSSATFTLNTTSTQVTNLSISWTATGRPVKLQLIPAEGSLGTNGVLYLAPTTSSTVTANLLFKRDSTAISNYTYNLNGAAGDAETLSIGLGGASVVDRPVPGVYTYTLFANKAGSASTAAEVQYVRLLITEL